MALYAIGDLHLSLGTDKPMDVFGGAWAGYLEKLRAGLAVIGPEDTTVLLGDLSWALGLEPVSYTHLDVYKRQAVYQPAAGAALSGAGRRMPAAAGSGQGRI